jgi:MFS transporter, DHA2 family, multidrug resistance protein
MTAAAIPSTVAPSAAKPSDASWVWSLGPFVVMCVGMFIALLDIQIVASSLQDIGGGLSAAQDQISWVQTAYLIAEIITIPLSGWLTRVFSTRWLFTASSVGFTIASMLCGLAWNIESMIVFRALQGMLGASMIPIVFTSTFHYFQGPRRVYSAAVVGAIASVAPTLGPVIGGFITDTLEWRWLFYANVVPGIAISILVPLLVKIDEPDLSLLKGADYPGIILLAMTLGTLEYVLEEGSRWNWFDDATIRDCTMIAAVAGFLFIVRSLTVPRPVVDLRALGNRNFTLGCILSFITGIGIFSTIYLTPLFLGYVRGYSAWQTGMAVFSTGMASLVGVPVYVILAKRFDTCWLTMIGLASFGLSMWSFSFITHDWGAAELFLPQILRGFPQVFAVAPSVNLGLGSLPPERLKYASGLFNMMRNLGGRRRHRGLRRRPQQPHQLPFPCDRLELDAGQRRNDKTGERGRATLPRQSQGASKRDTRQRSNSCGYSPTARRRPWPTPTPFSPSWCASSLRRCWSLSCATSPPRKSRCRLRTESVRAVPQSAPRFTPSSGPAPAPRSSTRACPTERPPRGP